MDFNLDDPLAGILSDGSDDSFFDDDILGKKKTPIKKPAPISDKKNALFDLGDDAIKPKEEPKAGPAKKESIFALGSDTTAKSSEDKNKEITRDIPINPSPTAFKRTVSKESITFNENAIKRDLPAPAKSPAKPKVTDPPEIRKEAPQTIERGKSSQSLLDDILGGPSSRPTTTQSQSRRPLTAAKNDFDSILGTNNPKPTATKDDKPKQIANKPKKETVPKKTKTSDDWLGLFQEDAKNEAVDDSGMPSWLVSGEKKKKENEEIKTVKTTKVEDDHVKEAPKQEVGQQIQMVAGIQPTNLSQGTSEDVAAEGAAVYLQQQEAQLMVALQLKAQEEKLAAMHMRQEESAKVQREAARASQEQVESMLRRQTEQRKQMQAVIAAHQDRITERIKALLGAPKTNDNQEEEIGNVLEATSEVKETPHSKEKKQLLQLVQSLQENHDKEIDLMETSYRRQLAFLEISLNQFEERMKEESDKVVKFYAEKISWLEEHHTQYKNLVEQNMKALTERNRTENEMLRQQHLENVRILQEHHATLMKNVKDAVKQEQAVIKDATGFSEDLMDLMATVKENKTYCQQLAEKVQIIAENNLREGEVKMQARHDQINEMMQQLNKEKEKFETEKTENRELVKSLESRLKQMTMMIEEESASLKKKLMEFEFEKATFSKQTEFAKNVLKKQDEEVKMLKEEIQREYQEKIARLDEEKAKAQRDSLAIAREKSTVQNLRHELEKMKSELHVQLEEVSEDRSRLNIEKQHIHIEEQRVLAKSRDLDLLAKAAMEKQTQADARYSEAESIQRKYEERIRRIQEHVVSLNNREKQIAREKVALSRERLSLHNERKQMEGLQQCSLCRSQNIPQYEATYDMNGPVSRDYSIPYVSSAANAFETEMVYQLGRNIGLRNAVGNASEDVVNKNTIDSVDSMKDYMDPKLMMLRLDVQQVLSNLENSKKEANVDTSELPEEHKDVA